MADRKKNRTKKKSNPNTRTQADVSVEEPDMEIETQMSSIKGSSSHHSTSRKRAASKKCSSKKRHVSRRTKKIPAGFQSKMGAATALPMLPTKVTRKKPVERKQQSCPQEEENPVVTAFVENVCELGVTGLRKMFSEKLAMLCLPKSKSSAFEDNPKKNRYMDIVCLEASRVILKKDKPDDCDYIHANWVNFEKHDRKFIATQAPLEHTCEDFWRMMLQNECPTIVNLTKIVEDGKLKCFQYWPEKAGAYLKFGSINIINKKVESDDKFTIFTLDCVEENCSDGHIVKMIHVTSWPEKGLPLSGLMILRMIRCITTVDPLAIGPVVVHCSAGISRTGIIILIDVILQRLFKIQMPVDLPELFKTLRMQRASCIQREGHFVFMVSTILDYIKARVPNKSISDKIDKFKAEFKAAGMYQN